MQLFSLANFFYKSYDTDFNSKCEKLLKGQQWLINIVRLWFKEEVRCLRDDWQNLKGRQFDTLDSSREVMTRSHRPTEARASPIGAPASPVPAKRGRTLSSFLIQLRIIGFSRARRFICLPLIEGGATQMPILMEINLSSRAARWGKFCVKSLLLFLLGEKKIWQSCSLPLWRRHCWQTKDHDKQSRGILVMLTETAALYFVDWPEDICFRFRFEGRANGAMPN